MYVRKYSYRLIKPVGVLGVLLGLLLFVASATGASQQVKLTASDGTAGDLLGFPVSIDGDTGLVGAPQDDDASSSSGSAYVYNVVALSPVEATGPLITEVESLDLPEGIQNSLVSKLDAAFDALERGKDDTAVNKLKALINQVEAQRGKRISDADVDALIAAAEAIIATITAGG